MALHSVAYLSDIEGGIEAWHAYLNKSQVLHFDINQTPHITLQPNCYFVFGGDVCDRGTGDIAILRDLISLKERYPNRVFFLMGNRDVNKLRLPVALHPKALAHPAQAFWVNAGGEEGAVLNDRVARLKWVSSKSFESYKPFQLFLPLCIDLKAYYGCSIRFRMSS
jgi:hypothetical protein